MEAERVLDEQGNLKAIILTVGPVHVLRLKMPEAAMIGGMHDTILKVDGERAASAFLDGVNQGVLFSQINGPPLISAAERLETEAEESQSGRGSTEDKGES